MLCADGWIETNHFPKATFNISKKLRNRLRDWLEHG
jgi:hypothetical protein